MTHSGGKNVWRCDVTKNPAGTDTVMIGHPCQCQGCRAAAEIERLRAALTAIRDTPDAWQHNVIANDALAAKDMKSGKRPITLAPIAGAK